ncbi:MAG: hypothetical protein K8T90_17120 [Planctomycetes bacterium]|nr:hypothetical protein [Planctomycetota bacterium]
MRPIVRTSSRSASRALVLAALAALVAAPIPSDLAPLVPALAGGDAPAAPSPLHGGDVKTLLDKAASMKAKDVRELGRALIALGEPAPKGTDPATRAGDVDFLVEYAVRETSRPLRVLAVESAQRIDAPGSAAAFAKKTEGEKDVSRLAFALEALALIGTKDQIPVALGLLKSPSEMVACGAADVLARIGTSKETDQVMDLGLTHAESHVTDHTAWAVQDIVKAQKTALERYQKVAAKKSDPRAIRADATAAMLADKAADPWKWTPIFESARKALLAAPATVAVKGEGKNAEGVKAAVEWMKAKMPAEHWLMCASVSSFVVDGKSTDTKPNFDDSSIEVKLFDAAMGSGAPHKLAYLLQRQAVVLWRKKVGEPWKGHRGWEAGIFDSYDLCVIGRMYDAGPAGLTRERFVAQILSGRPWGGL